MSWLYRRSYKFGPFRLTQSQVGFSASVGSKYFRLTRRADGKLQRTKRIPFVGLYKTDVAKSSKTQSLEMTRSFTGFFSVLLTITAFIVRFLFLTVWVTIMVCILPFRILLAMGGRRRRY